MDLRMTGCAVNVKVMAVTRPKWAEQRTKYVCTRAGLVERPPVIDRVSDRVTNVLVGMIGHDPLLDERLTKHSISSGTAANPKTGAPDEKTRQKQGVSVFQE